MGADALELYRLMDRTEFLKLCQKVSTYPKGTQGVIKGIPSEMLVKHAQIVFYPLGYKLTFQNGKPLHTAILHDLKANCTLECQLERVEKNGSGIE